MPARLAPTGVSGSARLASDPGAPDSQSVTVGGPSAAAATPVVRPSTRPSAVAPTTIDRRATCGRFFIARVFYLGAGADHNCVVTEVKRVLGRRETISARREFAGLPGRAPQRASSFRGAPDSWTGTVPSRSGEGPTCEPPLGPLRREQR